MLMSSLARPKNDMILNVCVCVCACARACVRVCVFRSPDVDECVKPGVCLDGRCVNTAGSFHCQCQSGFTTNPERTACLGTHTHTRLCVLSTVYFCHLHLLLRTHE